MSSTLLLCAVIRFCLNCGISVHAQNPTSSPVQPPGPVVDDAKLVSPVIRMFLNFGHSVAISESTIMTGVPDSSFGTGPGSVQVFTSTTTTGGNTTWTWQQNLTANDGVSGFDRFCLICDVVTK